MLRDIAAVKRREREQARFGFSRKVYLSLRERSSHLQPAVLIDTAKIL